MENNVLLVSLVGSRGCGLGHFSSDYDYKGLIFPTWEDVCAMRDCTTAYEVDNQDITFHDLRKVPNLFMKSNSSFLELFYSNEIKIKAPCAWELIAKRDTFARMNIPYFIKSALGQYHQRIIKGNNKDTMQAVKNLFHIQKLFTSGGKFSEVLGHTEEERKELFNYLFGRYSPEQVKVNVKDLYEHVTEDLVPLLLKEYEADTKAYRECQQLVREMVVKHLTSPEESVIL